MFECNNCRPAAKKGDWAALVREKCQCVTSSHPMTDRMCVPWHAVIRDDLVLSDQMPKVLQTLVRVGQ